MTQNQIEGQETINSGGAAPEDRMCHYTKSDGSRCHDWSLLGHDHCFRHHRYLNARPERPIEVPLLEDEASIVYVLSQTLQALAWGTLPTANGHALLKGCRLAHAIETTRLENAKLRLKVRRLGIPEHEIFDEPARGASPESGARCPVPGSRAFHQPRQGPAQRTSASATSRRTGTSPCSAPKMRWATCTSSVSAKARKISRPPAPLPSSTSPRRTAKSSAPAPWPKRKRRPVHQLANPRGFHRPAPTTEINNIPRGQPPKIGFSKGANRAGHHHPSGTGSRLRTKN